MSIGNIIWGVFWCLVLWFVAFPVALFCAGWYACLLPITVCLDGLKGITDLLLKGAQFAHFCAKHMMAGTPVGDALK